MTLEDMLIRDEGLRLTVYHDTGGVPTIGVGRNLLVGISREEALYLLRNDIANVKRKLPKVIPWYLTLSPLRQLVLENMAFNLGVQGLLMFTRTLSCIERGEYGEASRAMLESKWAKQVGPRALRLAWMMAHNTESP